MTYLQMVNSVLTRLREDEVTSVNKNSYSKLIGEFVKDAIQYVEKAWDWNTLKTQITFETIAGQSDYTLSSFYTDSEIKYGFNLTHGCHLTYRPLPYIERLEAYGSVPLATPMSYTANGTNEFGETVIKLYPTPDSAYNISLKVIKRTDVTTLIDSSRINIPTFPVIALAHAFALRERGEAGGQTVNEQLEFAKVAVSDAIAIDSVKNDEDLNWYTV
jgi:hypothetical protein